MVAGSDEVGTFGPTSALLAVNRCYTRPRQRIGGEDAMLNASHYHATETLPNGLQLLIRAAEPNDDLAGAIQRKVSPKSFFYRFLRPKHYLTDKDVASFVNCDFVSQVGLIGLVRDKTSMRIVIGPRYRLSAAVKAEIAFIVINANHNQDAGTCMLKHLDCFAR